MKENLRRKRIIDLTVEEYSEMIRESYGVVVHGAEDCVTGGRGERVEKHYLHGLKELADFLHCSKQNACTIKNSGIIDPAVAQIGNHIIIDRDMCFSLLSVRRDISKRQRKT